MLRASPLLEPPEGRRDRNTPRGVSEEGRGRIGADLVLRREGQLPRARDTKLAPFTSNLCSPRPFSTTLTLDLPSCNSGRRPIHYHLGCVTGTSFSTTTQQNPLRASFPEAPEPKGTTRLAHPSLFPGASALRLPRARDAVRSTHARDKAWFAHR